MWYNKGMGIGTTHRLGKIRSGLLLAFVFCLVNAAAVSPADENAPSAVRCCETALSFVEGWDSFSCPWNPQGAVYYTNGVLTVKPDRSDFHLWSLRGWPGAKPFRAPQTLLLETEGGAIGGTVSIVLRNRDSAKTVEVKTNWCDRTTFRLDLPPHEYWKVERIGFFTAKDKSPLPFKVKRLDAFSLVAPAEAIRLDVDTGSPLHITTDPTDIAVTFSNAAAAKITFEGYVTLSNYFGDAMTMPVAASLDGGGTVRIPVDLSQATSAGVRRQHGIWKVCAVVRACGNEARRETRFAVLNRNVVTPRLPYGKFRLGVNYHMGSYGGCHRRLTLDALTACGAKLVRTSSGFAAISCWANPDKMDFSGADVLMAELKERGLSVNVSCWPSSPWMVTSEQYKLGWPKWTYFRAKPGAMGEFAEKLAAHFGSDIDYVETSNEADLWSDEAMSADEYIDYQKEVFAGIRRGCPDIKVLPSAWAVADSSPPIVRRKGFLEKVMAETRGFYDIHPVHMHVEFSAYEKEVLEKLMPLRKRLGVTVPWYANETACTTVNGAEDSVARMVWMKILFSWAHGSSDYIWYNLRATGWSPNDPEQGYGLMTADYYPRSTYAAFSALAHIMTGMDFDGIVCEQGGRHLYRFRGMNGKSSVLVMAGWDGFSDPSCSIRLKTDAAHAVLVDLMGNSQPAASVEGGFVFPLSTVPSAIVLNGANFAETLAEDVRRIPTPKIEAQDCRARIEGRAPDFVLDKVGQVRQLYAGNPETVDRTWKGPSDLSAKVWVGREADALRVRFEVTDDRHVQHYPAERLYLSDGLQFVLESPQQRGSFEFGLARSPKGEPLAQTWIAPLGFDAAAVTKTLRLKAERAERTTVYDVRVPLATIGFGENVLSGGFRFNCIVYDDDGRGEMRDNWIELAPGIAEDKDCSRAPFVRIVSGTKPDKETCLRKEECK